jgi:hypothetical protein
LEDHFHYHPVIDRTVLEDTQWKLTCEKVVSSIIISGHASSW